MKDGFRQVGEHREGCFATNDKDGLTFIVYDDCTFNLNKNGAGRGSTMWHRFRCNDIRCTARMLVRWDVLSAFVSGSPAAKGKRGTS